jgi:hypothetical protein
VWSAHATTCLVVANPLRNQELDGFVGNERGLFLRTAKLATALLQREFCSVRGAGRCDVEGVKCADHEQMMGVQQCAPKLPRDNSSERRTVIGLMKSACTQRVCISLPD